MASVVAGGLLNAIAFAGAGYVFHKLDKNGYEKEMKRHNHRYRRHRSPTPILETRNEAWQK